MADIDFSKTKKKKKTKFLIEEEEEKVDELDDGFNNPLVFDGKRKKRNNFVLIQDDFEVLEEDHHDNQESNEYVYENMLMRFYQKLYASNPELLGASKRLKMVPPSLAKVGSKKISFVNFPVICRSLNRDILHVKQFLENELGTTSSVDQNNALLLRGRFQNAQIENVLRNYCKAFVLCKTCNSGSTRLEKECRLLFVACKACGSRYSVDQQAAGYKALTTKRAAIRAKAQ